MKIAVVGTGYVGLVAGSCFAELGNNVICVDINEEKIKMLNEGQIPIYEPGLEELVLKNKKAGRLHFTTDLADAIKKSDIIFIAVGTPPKPDGSADLSYVENVAREVAKNLNGYKVVVEKSTVPVETGEKICKTFEILGVSKEKFDVVSNPEFLREGNAVNDFMKPDRIVIGTDSEKAREIMQKLYAPLNAPIIFTDIKSAEIIKHASNSFLAMKISFINAVAKLCELTGADIDKVAEGMGADSRIGRQFLNAGIGYGGSCFPKDVQAFIHIAAKHGYDFKLLKEVAEINAKQRIDFVKKIENAVWNLNGKTIGILGLAFKPNTDDIREAPSIDIVKKLLEEGAKIRAYDPAAMQNFKKIMGNQNIEYCTNPYAVAKDVDALAILTEWDEFKKIDLQKLKSIMKTPIVIDGRNIFKPEEMKKLGFKYSCIGKV